MPVTWTWVRRCAALVVGGAIASPLPLPAQYTPQAGASAPPRQDPAAPLSAALRPRTLAAVPVRDGQLDVDGRLDEPAWSTAPVATDFVQQNPRPGALATQRTEARVLYDGRAIYVGVRAYDAHPDSIVAPYPRRDDETTSDWIFVEIDSRHDRRTAFSFGINPRGVQVDGMFYDDVQYDYAWNAVWAGSARIDSLGWTAEIRIPFSQLAYAGGREERSVGGASLTWGFNVYRKCARTGESSNWSPRLPTYSGVVSHFNDLVGLVPPDAPARVELVPYTAITATRAPAIAGDPFGDAAHVDPSAGADLRFRLTPALTLTAALHPDFGQVEADPSEVNLTTFETFLTERRPLFVEGADMFRFPLGLTFVTRGNDFSAEQPFYSRRIGRPPHGSAPGSAVYADVPASASLLGAAKLSGRTAHGWSIGALAALTSAEEARFVDSSGALGRVRVEPQTRYGVVRVAKDFGQGRSAVGAIASLVHRSAVGPELDDIVPTDALAAGVDVRHKFHRDDYEVSGLAMASRVAGTPEAIARVAHTAPHFAQRGDASHLPDDTTRGSLEGFAAQARVAKVGGSWHWSLVGHALSPGFEVNDVGFQRNADWLLVVGTLAYERYQPGHFVRRWAVGTDQLGFGWSFGGERRAAVANANVTFDLRSYWSGSVSVDHEFTALATDVLRGGPALLMPPRNTVAVTLNSDSRRSFQLAFSGTAFRERATASHMVDLQPVVAWRATDRLALSAGPGYTRTVNGWQYIDRALADGVPHYILGRLDGTTVSLTGRVDYAFGPTCTLQLYAQPFVSTGRFAAFKEVRDPRASRPADRVATYRPDELTYDAAAGLYRVDLDADGTGDLAFADPDFSRRDFNANAVLRWEYRPGSTLYVVWSQQRHAEVGGSGSFALGREVRRLFALPPTNVFLVKVSYWLPF